MTHPDPFAPRSEPARSLYCAFQDEAAHRRGRSVEEWTLAELNRVHTEVLRQAEIHQLRPLTLDEVKRAEACARGHIDYGSKWALGLVERMTRAGQSPHRVASVPVSL